MTKIDPYMMSYTPPSTYFFHQSSFFKYFNSNLSMYLLVKDSRQTMKTYVTMLER